MSPVKRKNKDNSTASKKKQAKRDVDNEPSEDEKENFDDLSDTEEVIKKPAKTKRKGAAEPKGKKKSTAKKRTKKELAEEDDENEAIEDVSTNVVEEGIIGGPSELKGKNKSNARKRVKKATPEEDNTQEELVDDGDKDEDENVTSRKKNDTEPKEKPKGRGRKKAAKEINGKAPDTEQTTLPEVTQLPAPTTRQRGRPVNYKKVSDDEGKPSRKKATKTAITREYHVTADSGSEGYIDVMKQVAKNKNEKAKKKAESHKIVAEKEDEEDDIDEDELTDNGLVS